MRFATKGCARKTRALMSELDAAYLRNDVTAAQRILDTLYEHLEPTAAMANTLEGATA